MTYVLSEVASPSPDRNNTLRAMMESAREDVLEDSSERPLGKYHAHIRDSLEHD